MDAKKIYNIIIDGIEKDDTLSSDDKQMLLASCLELKDAVIDEDMPVRDRCDYCNSELVEGWCPIDCLSHS